MATVKECIREDLNGRIAMLQTGQSNVEIALGELIDVDVKNANYVVCLSSIWKEKGEHSVSMKHKGTLSTAIKKAEQKYLDENQRNKIQADYKVFLMIGDVHCSVPERFWKKYKK